MSPHVTGYRTAGISGWLIAHTGGFVKNEKQAQQFLLGLAVLLILLAGWFWITGMQGAEKLDESAIEQIIRNQQGATAPRAR